MQASRFSKVREDIKTWFDLLDLDDHVSFGGDAQANFSRPINFNRVNLAIMAMHINGDWATAYFAILNRGKCAGRSVYDRCEYRSAVGAHYLRLYLEFHESS